MVMGRMGFLDSEVAGFRGWAAAHQAELPQVCGIILFRGPSSTRQRLRGTGWK